MTPSRPAPAASAPQGTVRAVLTGRSMPYSRPGSRSAIAKEPRTGPVAIGPLGLDGDEQGDPRVHGGPHKALHCYAWAHYAWWRDELGTAGSTAADRLQRPGAFGENLSLDGLDEGQVCMADQWRIGSAIVELSQGRQPCWKLNARFAVPDMARRVQQSLRAGWYLRVLQPGMVQAGDAVQLLARPYPSWSVARVLRVIAERDTAKETLESLLELPLPASWSKLFRGRLQTGQVEDWEQRMGHHG